MSVRPFVPPLLPTGVLSETEVVVLPDGVRLSPLRTSGPSYPSPPRTNLPYPTSSRPQGGSHTYPIDSEGTPGDDPSGRCRTRRRRGGVQSQEGLPPLWGDKFVKKFLTALGLVCLPDPNRMERSV